MPMFPRIGVLASGSGSNLQALIDASIEAEIAVVVSNRADAYCLERARVAGIPAVPLAFSARRSPEERRRYEDELLAVLRPFHLDLIVMAGWMLILSGEFLGRCGCPLINVHPALLEPEASNFPILRGARCVRDALKLGLLYTGVSVHHVIPEVDAGTVIAAEIVQIQPGDTEQSLYDRIKTVEHGLLPAAVEALLKSPPAAKRERVHA